GDRDPHDVEAREAATRRGSRKVGRPAERLVDGVRARVDGEVPDLVVVDQEGVARVDGPGHGVLGEGRAGVVAAIHIDVEGCGVVIGDADLARAVGGDPRTVVAGDGGAGRIERPASPPVRAGRDV